MVLILILIVVYDVNIYIYIYIYINCSCCKVQTSRSLLHTLYTLHIAHIAHCTHCTLHTLHTLYTLHTLHIAHIVYIAHIARIAHIAHIAITAVISLHNITERSLSLRGIVLPMLISNYRISSSDVTSCSVWECNMVCDWDVYGVTGSIGKDNIKRDIRTGGRARNMGCKK
jgi:hypothetical protein